MSIELKQKLKELSQKLAQLKNNLDPDAPRKPVKIVTGTAF